MPTRWSVTREPQQMLLPRSQDPKLRQVAKAILIKRSSRSTNDILNSKAEFRQLPIVRVRREVNIGI